MFCPNCGEKLDDDALFCVNCGSKVSSDSVSVDTQNSTWNSTQDSTQNSTQSGTGYSAKTPKAVKPKKKFPIIIPIIIATILVIAAAGFGVYKLIGNLGGSSKASKMKPAEYYSYVETKEILAIAEPITGAYGDLFGSFGDMGNGKFSFSINLQLSDEALEMLQGLLVMSGMPSSIDVDISGLKQIGATGNINLSDKNLSAEAGIIAGSGNLVSAEFILDSKNAKAYARIPELNQQYIGIDFSHLGFDFNEVVDTFSELEDVLSQISDSLPSEEDINEIISDYLECALGCIEEVEKEKTSIEVEGITQKVTMLTLDINGKELAAMIEAVAKKLKKDDRVKEIIEDFCELDNKLNGDLYYYSPSDPDEIYEDFVWEIDQLLNEIDDFKDEYGKVKFFTMKLYTDSNDKVVGRQIFVDVKEEDLKIEASYMVATSGKDEGFKLYVEAKSGDEKMSAAVSGTGKLNDGKLTGDYSLGVNVLGNKYSLLNINVANLDKNKLANGYVSGSFSISLDKKLEELYNQFGYELGYDVRNVLDEIIPYIRNSSITFDVDISDKSYSLGISPVYNKTKLGTFMYSIGVEKGKSVSAPSNVAMVSDENSLLEYLENCDISDVVSRVQALNLSNTLNSYLGLINNMNLADIFELIY